MTAKQISNDAYETLIELLPTLEQMKDSIKVENKFIANRQEVVKELEPLFKFIDFGRIKGQILVNIINPLEFIPEKTFLNIYRQKLVSNDIDSNNSREHFIIGIRLRVDQNLLSLITENLYMHNLIVIHIKVLGLK